MFQNLRSTRETELVEEFPEHVVCIWLGNSRIVAAKHYLQVTNEHFERAAGAAQNPAQYLHVSDGKERKLDKSENEKAPDLQGLTSSYDSSVNYLVGDTGFEPVTSAV